MEDETQEKTSEKQVVERNPNGTIKKGFTANPNGRPLGTLNFSTKWYKFLNALAKQNGITLSDG